MPTSPKITIITPSFNSSRHIATALESVVNQTYKNIEYLIIDNLSSDATVEIVAKFQNRYPHIRLIRARDTGIYDAMNKGIELSSGDWIYFLGSDDRLLTSASLSQIVTVINSLDCDILYGNVISKRFNGPYDGEFTYKKILLRNICQQSIFFKKTIFLKTGLFNLAYKSHADWNHNFQWFLSPHIKKVYHNMTVAEYGDGGYSSLHPDQLFEKDKVLNYLKFGGKFLPLRFRFLLVAKELKKYIILFDLTQIAQLLSIAPKVIAGTWGSGHDC
jgi:glycosyltransferase involved in cell wall biosynthesis